MAKMTGLGKGLDALFASVPDEEQIKEEEALKFIKISEIEPNRDQPRKTFDIDALEELSDSIKEYGLIQPIVVTKKDGYYAIIAGERRWRASKMAGLETVACIIREDNGKVNKALALIENMQREDLNPFEKAQGIKVLIEEYALSIAEVAKRLNKSQSTISGSVKILTLDERVLDLVKQGKISEGNCKLLCQIADPNLQYSTAADIVKKELTGFQVQRAIKTREPLAEVERKRAIYKNIEDKFQGFFGTKVKIDAGKKRGKIVIEYASNDDLERIIDLIN